MKTRPALAASTLILLASTVHAQTTSRAAASTSGVASNGHSTSVAISGDGRFVAFPSDATNLFASDTSSAPDVFLYDRASGMVELVSMTIFGDAGTWSSFSPALSDDGRFVAFESRQHNLVALDTNDNVLDVFVRDTVNDTTELISISPGGFSGNQLSGAPSISSEGRWVSFMSEASNLVVGDVNGMDDIFVRDRQLGKTEFISVDSAGVLGNGDSGSVTQTFTGYPYTPASQISNDGRYVVFVSNASNLVPADTNGVADVFLRDRQLATTTRVSVDANGAQQLASPPAYGLAPTISGDGRFVAFQSQWDGFVPSDNNSAVDVFLKDLATGGVELLSVSGAGVQANADSERPSLSRDGRYVVFESDSDNLVLGDTAIPSDWFLRDRVAGTTIRVTVSTNGVAALTSTYSARVAADVPVVAIAPSYSLADDALLFSHDVFVHEPLVASLAESYCTAKVNSSGCLPRIATVGVPRFTGWDAFYLCAGSVLSNKPGVFLWGLHAASLPFGGGTLCVQPPLVRSVLLSSDTGKFPGQCPGAFSYQFRQSYMQLKGLQPGDTVHGQFWSRDPSFTPPDNIGLTDAIRFTIVP